MTFVCRSGWGGGRSLPFPGRGEQGDPLPGGEFTHGVGASVAKGLGEVTLVYGDEDVGLQRAHRDPYPFTFLDFSARGGGAWLCAEALEQGLGGGTRVTQASSPHTQYCYQPPTSLSVCSWT